MTSTPSAPSAPSTPSTPSTPDLRRTVERFWAAAEERDWAAFAGTLAEDVLYELPQTRERIRGRERYVQFNREYPGDWHARIERVVAEPGHVGETEQPDRPGQPGQVVSWTYVTVGLEEMYAISFFTGDSDGRIATVTDFWPEPYEPPAGREHLVERY
ncbi:nuclear transport factor 2 family protein [Streptomyces europaeiscabiei]|uniref:nuclear transport factor 2 family protein n=1 Tax=Streptomyces europaeiscabiei TaxID=146819 RepID=UPI0029A7D105|nr:nuclear transport factor 2 family protein [Streptomyces europaeiscabiei]MDX2769487.1 nuclear transport factor 2 family protein [Streptomyces europaeiscabiei]